MRGPTLGVGCSKSFPAGPDDIPLSDFAPFQIAGDKAKGGGSCTTAMPDCTAAVAEMILAGASGAAALARLQETYHTPATISSAASAHSLASATV